MGKLLQYDVSLPGSVEGVLDDREIIDISISLSVSVSGSGVTIILVLNIENVIKTINYVILFPNLMMFLAMLD